MVIIYLHQLRLIFTSITALPFSSQHRSLQTTVSSVQIKYTVIYEFPILENYSSPNAYFQIYTYFGNLTHRLVEKSLDNDMNRARQQYCLHDNCGTPKATIYTKPTFLGPFRIHTNHNVGIQSSEFFSSKLFMYLLYVIPVVLFLCLIFFLIFCCLNGKRRTEQSLENWLDSESGEIKVHKVVRNAFLRFTPASGGNGLNLKDIYQSGDDVNVINPAFSDSQESVHDSDSAINLSNDSRASKRNSLRNFQASLQELRDNNSKASKLFFPNDQHLSTPELYDKGRNETKSNSKHEFINTAFEDSSDKDNPFISSLSPMSSQDNTPRKESLNRQSLRNFHASLIENRKSSRIRVLLSKNSEHSNISFLDLYNSQNEYDQEDPQRNEF